MYRNTICLAYENMKKATFGNCFEDWTKLKTPFKILSHLYKLQFPLRFDHEQSLSWHTDQIDFLRKYCGDIL